MSEEQKDVCSDKVYRKVYDTNVTIIRNFIYYKCRDMEQAEDITQDAFIKLWQNCKKVLIGKAKSFLLKVAQNAFYNEANHQKVVLKYNKQAVANKVYAHSPEFLMEEKEFLEKLERCISNLPERQRVVFLLSRKDKKTYREIAEIVGVTQSAIEQRMHLALVTLREQLGRKI